MKKLFKYLFYIIVCLCILPTAAKAYISGTLGPGYTASASFAWWDEAECTANVNGPFQVVSRKSYYKEKDSYYRFVDVIVDDYVERDYNNIKVTCKCKDDPNHPIQSGRVTSWSYYYYYFNIVAGGEAVPKELPRTFSLYKGDVIDLKDELNITKIKSFEHSVGSELGTIRYSGCSVGTGACSLTFPSGNALQDREHRFVVVYVAEDGNTYRSTVTAKEMDTKREFNLGDIQPTATVKGLEEDNVSNFSCTKSDTSAPYTVEVKGSGSKYQIAVTNTNTTMNSYSNKKAVCTFKRNGKTFEYTYNFGLMKNDAQPVTKDYELYPNESVNPFSDLKMKTIISGSSNFSTDALTYEGCVANASSCKMNMKSVLKAGRVNFFTVTYYDTSNKLKTATIRIFEKENVISKDLGTISTKATKTDYIAASNVSCTFSDSYPYTGKVTNVGANQYRLDITNENLTVQEYKDVTVSCTGVPQNVGGNVFTYNFKFTLADEQIPVEITKDYELFPTETVQLGGNLGIKAIRTFNYKSGSNRGVLTTDGCNVGSGVGCKIMFTGASARQDAKHVFELLYVNSANQLYKATINITEKDPSQFTRAYPGLLGFCDFNSDWEYTQWNDASGKRYTFYESEKRGAVLPDCDSKADNGVPLTFKGWKKGYQAGDPLTTMQTCGADTVPAGSVASFGSTYAPCYEMTPNIRLSINGGSLKDKTNFTFNPSDMTYMSVGPNFEAEIALPDVEYTGFKSSTKLQAWKNYGTGETKAPGDKVKYDGSVWIAVTSRTVEQLDLYKSVGKGEKVNFVTTGMASCSLASGSNYISVTNNSANCMIEGLEITPFDVYADVEVRMDDGTVRVYKYSVEDRSTIGEDDNGIFNVDTDNNIEMGKNDASTLNDFKTDQCEDFLISSEGYSDSRTHFADSISNSEGMYTGIYSVFQLCPTDSSTYVALCLDPGRRGPNESGTGSHSKTFEFKGQTVTKKGNEYKKTNDIQRGSEFGKLVTHIVTKYNIENFDSNESTYLKQRAAAHVAVRSMAIYTGFSSVPDPSDEVYSTHYYPYQGVSDGIRNALSSGGDISTSEATSIVDNGYGGLGFKNWDADVRTHVINILANYGGTDDTGPTDGFTRTIDETEYKPIEENGKEVGYTINYKGTITAPSGSTANMIQAEGTTKWCRNAEEYGAKCIKNDWAQESENNGRITYKYDVTIEVPNAAALKPPTTVEEEKDLSFQISYEGGHDLVNAFIASPKNGSDNVQRMLVLSVDNPKVYIYFSVVPDSCDLPSLKQELCKDKDTCIANVNNGTFNSELFKAAGCCRYVHDETTYLWQKICNATCTSSTLTSACDYVTNGKEKADFYEINEGAMFDDEDGGYEDRIGTCIVNVTDYFVNDGAASLKNVSHYELFEKFDDRENLLNIDAYNDNRYCQVTCEEDWEFSMDSFGNFIGEDAVAAGTYFQIVSNDMFIGAKRTCYTTFINYDRFMTNIVNLSNQLVDWYNTYSRWSHVWTDVDEQIDPGYNAAKYFDHKAESTVCVEYFDKCPQGTSLGDYYWSDEVNDCRMVPEYGSSSGSGDNGENCVSKPSTYSNYDYYDEDVYYNNGGANNDTTECEFKRWYCGEGKDDYETDEINSSNNRCYYYNYYTKDSEKQDTFAREYDVKSDPDGSGPKGLECPSGTTASGIRCYYSCGDGYYASGGTCYESTPSGYTLYNGYFYENCSSNYHTYSWNFGVCQSDSRSWYSASSDILNMDPDYNEEDLKCRVWGKGYDYTLKTEDDIEVTNSDGQDVYYDTDEYDRLASEGYDDRDSIANVDDYRRQNKEKVTGNVKGDYKKQYTHNCTLTEAEYKPSAQGSSSCQQSDLVAEAVGASSYSKTDDMFCADGKYANLTGGSKDKAFCYAGGSESYTNNRLNATKDSGDYSKEEDAFKYVTESFKDHAKKELDNARSQMVSLNSRIYSHAQDVFDCQNFQLHNRTDDSDSTRANNQIPDDTIMGMKRSYVKINTDYDPIVSYTYDEGFFMERIDDDNILIQYEEKNDGVYQYASGKESGAGPSTCTSSYKGSTNCRIDATIQTPSGTVNTKLSRNFVENAYYNPIVPWSYVPRDGETEEIAEERINKYHDSEYVVTPTKAAKKIVLCTVGVINNGTGYMNGKDGAVIPFASTASTPEWLGGRCYQVTVDYKKVHYVKSSLSNSSYFKNKGYWYVRGGDSKIHGDDIEDAISKFNRIQPSGYIKDYDNNSDEHKRWSRLGSFNVFPISMATPKNLYQYTYAFANIGSYHTGDLGRIMGTQKSIIQDNKRTCFYEVFEEVCLCCGYKIPPGDLVISSGIGNNFGYTGSDPNKAGGNTGGTISYYTNSVSLGDIDLGRDNTLGSNWSDSSPFMYNGDDSLTTDKGHKLKENIEKNGENIYARDPEYAYYLTPDTLKQIRSYNDANGYDLNLDKLIVYEADDIACDGSNCKKGNPETINFQHYGSKFLLGQVDGGQSIELNSYGSIKDSHTKVCVIYDDSYSKNYDMGNKMKSESCRWVDFVEKNNNYYNPTTKQTTNTWFRLAFK